MSRSFWVVLLGFYTSAFSADLDPREVSASQAFESLKSLYASHSSPNIKLVALPIQSERLHSIQSDYWGLEKSSPNAEFQLLLDFLFRNKILDQFSHLLDSNHSLKREGVDSPSRFPVDFDSLHSGDFEWIEKRPHLELVHRMPYLNFESVMQSSQEAASMVVARPGDQIAGRSIFDMCGANLSKEPPRGKMSALPLFSMASTEASTTSFELFLMGLFNDPDPLNGLPSLPIPFIHEHHDDFVAKLSGLASEISQNSSVKVSQLVKVLPENLPNQRNDAVGLGLVQLSGRLSSTCKDMGGKWREGFWSKKAEEFSIFECSHKKDQFLFGMYLEFDDELQEDPAVVFEVQKNQFGLKVSTRDDQWERLGEIVLLSDQEIVGNELVFDHDLNLRGMWSHRKEGQNLIFDRKGNLYLSAQTNESRSIEETTWSESRLPLVIMRFESGGDLGSYASFYPSGSPRRSLTFERQRAEAIEVAWHENGKIASIIEWRRGKKFGLATLHHHLGEVGFQARYFDDRIDGPIEWKSPLGKPLLSGLYNMGRMNGDVKVTSENGVILASAKYDMGRVSGNVQIGHPIEGTGAVFPFVAGVLEGLVDFWIGGKKILSIPYRSGVIEGRMTGQTFSGDGKVECQFNHGVLESWQYAVSSPKGESRVLTGDLNKKTSRIQLQITDKMSATQTKCDAKVDAWGPCQFLGPGGRLTPKFTGYKGLKARCVNHSTASWSFENWRDTGLADSVIQYVIPKGCGVNGTELRCRANMQSLGETHDCHEQKSGS